MKLKRALGIGALLKFLLDSGSERLFPQFHEGIDVVVQKSFKAILRDTVRRQYALYGRPTMFRDK